MIHSRLNDQLLIVLNEAIAPFSLRELQRASKETRRLARIGYAVIWDFRRLTMNHMHPAEMLSISRAMSKLEIEPTPQKRAFLVSNTTQQGLLEEFIGQTSVGWPWGVFVEFGDALEWLDT